MVNGNRFADSFLAVCFCLSGFLLHGAEIFHFNFRDADGKSELKSGEAVLKSRRVPLLSASGAGSGNRNQRQNSGLDPSVYGIRLGIQ